ncbi:unnamed protein product [Menidia menidia]|uniref:(Atlantic silverside) hypothetical protein n=1 Tax=Menidia menidia TaxID=238744 RepID=A0A8S4ABG9_9TELE|nr:unnamed protein product [Menidia menidia]
MKTPDHLEDKNSCIVSDTVHVPCKQAPLRTEEKMKYSGSIVPLPTHPVPTGGRGALPEKPAQQAWTSALALGRAACCIPLNSTRGEVPVLDLRGPAQLQGCTQNNTSILYPELNLQEGKDQSRTSPVGKQTLGLAETRPRFQGTPSSVGGGGRLVNGMGAWKPVESARSEQSEPLDFQPPSM